MKAYSIILCGLTLLSATVFGSCSQKKAVAEPIIDLPRTETPAEVETAAQNYIAEMDSTKNVRLHSLMILKHGEVIYENWVNEGHPDSAHVMFSVSKTFTATAIGFAIYEGKLKLTDKLVDIFPDKLPEEVGENLAAVTVRDLLTMTCGQEEDVQTIWGRGADPNADWVKEFLAAPYPHKPGTWYFYNSLGSFMLSAIVQKVTGEKVLDYLMPRLFDKLHISRPRYDENPQGINLGGWGLYLKTEDMAKMGQLFLQNGMWNGEQVVPAEWIAEASAYQVPCCPSGTRPDEIEAKGLTKENSFWMWGYCYQMWRCPDNAYRADGLGGQYIVVFPDKDAVVISTAGTQDLQKGLEILWRHIVPVL